MYENYEIILSDSESLHLSWRESHRMRTLEKLIENFSECLDGDGGLRSTVRSISGWTRSGRGRYGM